ncbi:MAG: 16S rRNA (cytosine(967)-C(5))-methyltransferase RsmB [Clostridiales bacterium]|nr:16S rRNA (cytosine(967)-C(5))-methyltransferase RsmB [Clostridiales bacterium]
MSKKNERPGMTGSIQVDKPREISLKILYDINEKAAFTSEAIDRYLSSYVSSNTNQSSHSSQPINSNQSIYSSQPINSNQSIYPSQSIHSNQSIHSSKSSHSSQPAHQRHTLLSGYVRSPMQQDQLNKAFITEIVLTTIKWKGTLDFIIDIFTKVKINKISPWILNIIRMGIAQMRYMNKIPPSAAVNESVKLAKKYGHMASAAFVNAMLRAIITGTGRIDEAISALEGNKKLAVIHSHPLWLIERWTERYGQDFTISLMEANNKNPGLTLRVNTLKTSVSDFIHLLDENGIKEAQTGRHLPSETVVLTTPVGNPAHLPGFKEGLFQVQDESSVLVSKILDPQPGEFIIDLCSAPGGKSTHIAQLMKNSGKVLAWDLYPERAELVAKAAKRLKLSIIEASLQNAMEPVPEYFCKADRVLADVPCSGFGIIRKKPDIKWSKKEEDIALLAKTQLSILNAAALYLKPGGVLVYSTCTLEPEENAMIIEAFLEMNPEFHKDPIEPYLPSTLKQRLTNPHSSYSIQIFPHVDFSDGFFIARLKYL